MTLRALLLLLAALGLDSRPQVPERRAQVDDVARWLTARAISTPAGLVWPRFEGKPESVRRDLYHGSPGVVLFFLAAHELSKNDEYLRIARAGADDLVAQLPQVAKTAGHGLYTGTAGVVFTLLEVHRVTGESAYLKAARQATEELVAAARPVGRGVEWNDSTDIVSGSAGIGSFLLAAAQPLRDPSLITVAERAGTRLLELARPDAGGLTWAMTRDFPREMPNFSHGTAGVAFFLVRLYEATGKKEFLAAALAGATYLENISPDERPGGRVPHHFPGGEELFYLSWCHGPPGTARLYAVLARATEDPRWSAAMETSVQTLLNLGVPERRTAGFWSNEGVCCGSAGIGNFFVARYLAAKNEDSLRRAEAIGRLIAERGTRDEAGLRWIHAEHRVRPEEVFAQTGYMQGAAGIGLFLLRLEGVERKSPVVRLPDDPFPR